MPDVGSWCGEKKKGSHVAALAFCRRGENAARYVGLWMRWLLFIRAKRRLTDSGPHPWLWRRRTFRRPSPVCLSDSPLP